MVMNDEMTENHQNVIFLFNRMVVDHHENERSNFVEFPTKFSNCVDDTVVVSRIQEFVNSFEDVLPTAHYTQIPMHPGEVSTIYNVLRV